MPGTLLQIEMLLGLGLPRWAAALIAIVGAAAAGVVVYLVVVRIVRRVIARTPWGLDNVLLGRLDRPARIGIPVLFVLFAIAQVELELDYPLPVVQQLTALAAIAVLTWFAVAITGAFAQYIRMRYDVEVADNRVARRVHTQVTVLGRSVQTLIVIIGTAVALMTFPQVQQFGTSLLASAGIAGLVVGLAARPVLENLIAGLQIGFTQPIRLDDVVVIDGEWGRIEEITLTYVVVRIWDERRLVVPFSRLLSTPFQNWTRTSAQLLAPVLIWVDYTAPLEPIRAAAERIVREAPGWDGRVCNVQVTDASEDAMQIRVLGSSPSGPDAWNFRVHVREKLIDYLQREHPGVLPQRRIQMREPDGEDARLPAPPPQPLPPPPAPHATPVKKPSAARPARGHRRK